MKRIIAWGSATLITAAVVAVEAPHSHTGWLLLTALALMTLYHYERMVQ